MFPLEEVMRRRKRRVLVLAGLCLSFLLGTWLNLLPEPGLEPRPAGGSSSSSTDPFYREKHTRRGGELAGDTRLHVGGSPEPPRGLGGRETRETRRDPAGSLHELQLQIRERYDEVSRYRHLLRALPGRPLERRRLMDLEPPVNGQVHRNPAAPTGTGTGTGSGGSPRLGLRQAWPGTDVQYPGSGYTKAVHRAALNRSLSVALKSVDLAGHDMETCGQRYRDTGACYRLASLKIVKEMVLMETLQHPNVLKICMSLVRLLHFLSHSPLGSVSLLDFRPRQFVLVDGELKVTDLDDASAHETPCTPLTAGHDCTLQFPARNFTLACSRGRCELRWGVEETLSKMEEVLHLYRTGRYLQSLNHSTTGYKEVLESSIPEQDVRCWPSHQHNACLLAVFDLREAMSLCQSHAHCHAFVFTNQTTWTGHHLVYLKSGWSGLSRAAGQLTYVQLA
ncbi:LOW QUALITY PROTEIN: hypothetical protein CRUP_026876, partial [Coryphaenoides rupestris]